MDGSTSGGVGRYPPAAGCGAPRRVGRYPPPARCPGPELRAAGAQILLRYFVFRGPNFAKFGCKFYFRTDFVLHFEMRNYCTKKRILYKQACFSCFTPSALITCGSCTLFIHCIAENIHATVDWYSDCRDVL